MPEAGAGRPGERGFRPWRVAWAEALYGERGFYRRAEGPRGHFETSANAGGGVVDLLAEALSTLAARHGCTQVVDVGAGRGELLTALRSVRRRPGGLHSDHPGVPPVLTGVDVVPRPAGLAEQVRWLQSPGGAELPADLRDLDRALVVAHEWLDVVPCDLLQVDPQGRLRLVEVDPGGRERLGPPPAAELLDWCARWWPTSALEPGIRVEAGLARDVAWAGLVGRVRSGVVVAVDYGHLAADRPPYGTLAAHRDGHLVPAVPDGTCDLTAEVAWDSLLVAGAREPATGDRVRLTSQREALAGLGLDGVRPEPGGDPATYLNALQRASAAATLLDPGGFGGLGWLVQEVATGQAVPPPARVGP